MWKTIKLKFTAYKWAIITAVFAGLIIAILLQYNQVSSLKHSQETLEKDKKELQTKVDTITTNFNDYKADVNTALADLEVLRGNLKTITTQTAKLQSRVDALSRKPAPGGANYQEIQDEANQLTNDIFGRIQDTSKGK